MKVSDLLYIDHAVYAYRFGLFLRCTFSDLTLLLVQPAKICPKVSTAVDLPSTQLNLE